MKRIIKSQKEFDELPKSFDELAIIEIRSNETITIRKNIKNCEYHLHDSSSAYLYDSSRAYLYGSSRAYLYDSSSAKLYGSSRADLYDSSRADLYCSSRAKLYDSSSADLYDSSRADLLNDSFCFVHNSSVKVKAFEKSNIVLKNGNINIELFDEATVKDSIKQLKIDFDTWIERGFVVADGIYRELISQKEIDNYKIYETDKGFVAKFESTFAHGETEQEAIFDLKFKLSDRNKDQFKKWKIEEIKTKEELILAYRVITGACSQGVKEFVRSKQISDSMTIKQAIEITEGHYGHEKFKEFFDEKNN